MNKTSTEVCGARRPRKNKLVRFLGTPLALALAIAITGCAGNQYERSTGESVDDSATTGRVKRALMADKTYKYSDVKVTTFKGNVQLSGFVDSNEQKAKATELAQAVSGVKEVENRITIK
jgi:osmotically-inducible protein OsmY